MKTTYTKEQAEQVLKDLNEFYGRTTPFYGQDKDFLNHKFPSLEVGKWYWLDNRCERELLICQQEYNPAYGIDADGNWCNDMCNIYPSQKYRPATGKEVEEALIAEAKRRGYKDGVIVNSFVHKMNLKIKYSETNSEYIVHYNILHFGKHESRYIVVYQNGQWAEIVDPTKDKIAELEATINKAQQELKELKGLVD